MRKKIKETANFKAFMEIMPYFLQRPARKISCEAPYGEVPAQKS
jgi:hypothetical protein